VRQFPVRLPRPSSPFLRRAPILARLRHEFSLPAFLHDAVEPLPGELRRYLSVAGSPVDAALTDPKLTQLLAITTFDVGILISTSCFGIAHLILSVAPIVFSDCRAGPRHRLSSAARCELDVPARKSETSFPQVPPGSEELPMLRRILRMHELITVPTRRTERAFAPPASIRSTEAPRVL
jgi:hypothetical protein